MLAGESLNFILFKNATNFWNKNSKGYMIHLFYLKVMMFHLRKMLQHSLQQKV